MAARSWRIAALVLVSLALSACGSGGGGALTLTGVVTGTVFNLDANNSPVSGALVKLSSGTPSTTTGADGRYTLSNVSAGTQALVASASGFPAVQRQVSVPAQGTATLNFGLTSFGNPTVVGPSSYKGPVLTVNVLTQGQSVLLAATVAPHSVDGGTYSLQAVSLSYLQPSVSPQQPKTSSVSRLPAVDTLSGQLRQLEREAAGRLPRKFPVTPPPIQLLVGSQATFWVISSPSPIQQQLITATLQAESTHGLVYVDNQDLTTISQATAASLLQTWEAEIFTRVTQVFGFPQNPYNSNGQGQVTLLFSRTVNLIVGEGGYFFVIDLYPDSQTFPTLGLHSNQRDLLYFSTNATDAFRKGTMAHEFQHLINFSQHVFVFGGSMEVTWINEGLSMAAMDVAGYGFQVGNTTPYASSFVQTPGSVSLWNWQNTAADYGAGWLFFRYLADRFGNQILRKLVQTTLTGASNVETQTGEPIGQVIGEEALAVLNIAFQAGLTSPYTYTSISGSNLGAALTLTAPGSTSINSGGYHFYGFSISSPTLPAARIAIQAGTAMPWVSVW
jgi:hypothetical protein